MNIKSILAPGTNFDDRFIPDFKKLKAVVDDLKRAGYKVVLTQGVFDLIHQGHAQYLEKALSYGDILIVGVDSDAFTRKRKGPNRPVVPQAERLKMLSHLRHVHILTVREVHHGIGELIHLVEPDVLITSETTKEFTKEEVAKYKKVCGKIVTLPAQATTSTTARVRSVSIDGADQLAKELMKGMPELVKGALGKIKNG